MTYAVYEHFDKKDRLLYVGMSTDAWQRTLNHSLTARWFKRIKYIKITHCDNKEEALEVEKEIIQKDKPFFNLRYNRPTCFRMFLYQQEPTDDPQGCFIEDVLDDVTFPDYDNLDQLESYIHFRSHTDHSKALAAMRVLWKEYKRVR